MRRGREDEGRGGKEGERGGRREGRGREGGKEGGEREEGRENPQVSALSFAPSKAAGTWGLLLPDDNRAIEEKPAAAVLSRPLEGSVYIKLGQGLTLSFPSKDHTS